MMGINSHEHKTQADETQNTLEKNTETKNTTEKPQIGTVEKKSKTPYEMMSEDEAQSALKNEFKGHMSMNGKEITNLHLGNLNKNTLRRLDGYLKATGLNNPHEKTTIRITETPKDQVVFSQFLKLLNKNPNISIDLIDIEIENIDEFLNTLNEACPDGCQNPIKLLNIKSDTIHISGSFENPDSQIRGDLAKKHNII